MANEFIIDTSLNVANVEKDAKKINQKMTNLGKSVEKTSNKMKQSVNNALSQNTGKMTQEYASLDKELARLGKRYDDIAERQYKFLNTGGKENSRTYKSMEYDLDSLEQKIDMVKAKMLQMEQAGTAFQQGQNGNNASGQKGVKIFGALENSYKNIVKNVKNISPFRRFTNMLEKQKASLAGNFKTLMKYAFGIRTLFLLANKLRSALVDGFNNLAQFRNGVNPVNDSLSSLKSSLTTLKNSFATAFAPILTYVTPVLNTLINALSSAITMIGMFFAQLTGQSSFIKATKAQEKYVDATKDASKAQDDLNNKLGEYDKLAVIDSNKSSSSSGGGGTSGGANFEEVPISQTAKEWAEKFKEAWENADFTEIGSTISGKIADALNNIDWTDIKEKSYNIGKSIATFINGFFDKKFCNALGKTIGEAINSAVQLAKGFIDNLKVEELASNIASGINTAVSTINATELGQTVNTFVKKALKFVTTLLKKTDFEAIGKKIGEFLKELDLGEWISSFATLVWEGIKSAFALLKGMFQEAPLETSLLTAFAVLKFTGLGSFIAKKIGTAIITKVTDGTLATTLSSFGSSLLGILTADLGTTFASGSLATIGATVATGICGAIAGAIAGYSFGNWLGKKLFPEDMDLYNGYSGFKGAKKMFMDLGVAIKDYFVDILPTQLKGVSEKLGRWFKSNVVDGITNKFSSVNTTISEYFKATWVAIKTIFSKKTVEAFFNGVVSNIKGCFNSIASWFGTTFAKAWAKVKEVFSTGGKIFSGIKEGILAGLKAVINKLIDGINKAIKEPFDGINSALNKIRNIDILGGKPFDGLPTIAIPKIPHLATGAVIPPNHEFLAMLGDQKNGVNIETPLDTMIQAFQTALDSRGGGMPESIRVYLNESSNRPLAEAVWSEEDKYYKQTGLYRPSLG